MTQPRFPDAARSRAVLIGASHFTAAGLDLPDIPAVQANLTALRQALTDDGRPLLVVLAEALDGRWYVATARELNDTERRTFRRKGR